MVDKNLMPVSCDMHDIALNNQGVNTKMAAKYSENVNSTALLESGRSQEKVHEKWPG